MRACALVACAAGALAMLSTDVSAQTRTAAQAERDGRSETARATRLRNEANAARREIAALDARLVESGRRRTEAEAAASAAEARLAALRTQIVDDTAQQRRARRALEAALTQSALSQRNRDPQSVRAGIFARAAAPGFAHAERVSRQALAQARSDEDAVLQEQAVLADAQAAIDSERAELVTLTARRRAVQATLVRDADAAERRARALAQEARNLRQLAQQAAARAVRRPGAGAAGVIPTSWAAPAEGQIVAAFGARESAAAPAAQGARVRTRAGAQVVSPAAGEVTYAGPFRSYGQVLILNLDGGYALVLTGLDNVRVRVGDTVRSGQPIGEMPISDMTAPELYVEVRRDGRPIDPGRWLSARGLSAQSGVRAG
ncbi:MAG TPA: peptidoglycan DD-metalloendopeptidase family protein [Terricaulis sp.]|nr:peptidoglycan DD-metalloendopeptidase family protein [Terricaulis sp.]